MEGRALESLLSHQGLHPKHLALIILRLFLGHVFI